MGFDQCRFECTVNSEFLCSICQDVLEDPLVIPKCEHVFCSACIKDWLGRSNVCPFDRMEATVDGLQLPLRSFCNLLNDLKISCSFQSCRKYVRLNELSEHTKNCIHNPINDEKEIDCSKGCGAKIKLKDKHDCVQYMKKLLADEKIRSSNLEKVAEDSLKKLSEEKKSLQSLKDLFQKESKQLEDRCFILKQEINTKDTLIANLQGRLDRPEIPKKPKKDEYQVKTAVLVELQGEASHNSKFYASQNKQNPLNRSNSSLENCRDTNSKSVTKSFLNRISSTLGPSDANIIQAKAELMEYTRKSCRNNRVRNVLNIIDRIHFYPGCESYKTIATKKGAHSFPFIFEVRLLELIEPLLKSTSHVLDIGSGMGFLTCCIAQICKTVVGVEHVKELVAKSQEIVKVHYKALCDENKIRFTKADGRYGYEKYGPYDLILIEPLVKQQIPDKILSQLKPKGFLVCTIKTESNIQIVKVDAHQRQEVLFDDRDFLTRVHKDALIDISHQEIIKFKNMWSTIEDLITYT